MSLFECAWVTWADLMEATTPEMWDAWAARVEWSDLPWTQAWRHRCADGMLYMGDGWVSYKYTESSHANLEETKPNWFLYLARIGKNIFVLGSRNFICLPFSPHFIVRYLSKERGDSFIVRPMREPAGLKLFAFEYNKEQKQLTVRVPTSGELVGIMPGKWGPRSSFWKAMRLLLRLFEKMVGCMYIGLFESCYATSNKSCRPSMHSSLSVIATMGTMRRRLWGHVE